MSRQNGIQLRERFYAIYVCNENTQFLAAASFLPVQYEYRGVGIGGRGAEGSGRIFFTFSLNGCSGFSKNCIVDCSFVTSESGIVADF